MLSRLAPARMIDSGIDVRIEPILVRRLDVPGCRRLAGDQTDLYDGLNALESVLPRNHQSNWRAVLRRHRLPVKPGRENREGIHGLIQAQALDIRPIEDACALIRHPPWIQQRLKGHVVR